MEMTVKNHKDAIKNIQAQLKTLVAKKREAKQAIVALKFDDQGNRRPETGTQRDYLWNSYQWPHRAQARACNIALGFLRGRSYAQIETKCEEMPRPVFILNVIREAFGEDKEQAAEWTLPRICDLLQGADVSAKEAA